MDEVERLIRKLRNQNPFARENAAKALGMTSDDRVVEPLIRSLSDKNPFVAWHSAESLFKLSRALGNPELSASINNPCVFAMENTVRSLNEIADQNPNKAWIRRAIPLLIQAIGTSGCNDSTRYAAKALVKLGEPAVFPLIDALHSKNVSLQGNASQVLGCIQDERVFPALLVAMKDRGNLSRDTVAGYALAAYFERNSVSEDCFAILVNTYRKAQTKEDKAIAIRALGATRELRAFQIFIDSLKSPCFEVRNEAFSALVSIIKRNIGRGKTLEMIAALTGMMEDENSYIQFNTSSALNHIYLNCKSMDQLKEFEDGLNLGFSSIKLGKYLTDTSIFLVKLKMRVVDKKNELAPQRDILLDDIPKPPKKTGIYQQIRRTVRNG